MALKYQNTKKNLKQFLKKKLKENKIDEDKLSTSIKLLFNDNKK